MAYRYIDKDQGAGRIRWILLGVIAVAVLLRFFRLTNQSLWFDEGTTLEMTDSTSLVGNFTRFYHLTTGGERFQMLYNLVIPYWRFAFGDSAFALRTFSAIASIGAVIFVVAIARRVYGPVHAIWTGALAACSSFAVFYAQEARPYALLLLLSSAQTFFLTPVLAGAKSETVSPWWRRAHAGIIVIGSFASIFFCMFATALAMAHLITRRHIKDWLRWWIPALVAATPAIVFYLGTGQVSDPVNKIVVSRHGFPVIQSLMFVVYGVLVGPTYGPSVLSLHGDNRWKLLIDHGLEVFALGVALLGMGIVLARVLKKRDVTSPEDRSASLLLLVAALIALGLATLLAVVTRVTWLPRHSFYLWIPIVLLVPLLRKERSWLGGSLGISLLVLFLGLNLYSLSKYYFRYEYSKGDDRGVAQYLTAPENLTTPSVLMYGYLRLLRYYGDARTLDGTRIPPARLAEGIREITNGAPKALVVLTHEDYWRRTNSADPAMLLGQLYRLDSAVLFQNFKVFRLSLK